MSEFPFGDLGITVFMGLVVGALGVLAEAIISRRQSALWSAQLYLKALQSPAGLWWRNYAQARRMLSRNEQLLISFMVFFVVGSCCAVVVFAFR